MKGAPALGAGISATSTRLVVREPLALEEWFTLGHRLGRLASASLWLIGDWLVYGERAPWGATYRLACEATGLAHGTLRNLAYVARAVDPLRRRDGLSWAHHEAVAALAGRDQEQLLEQAERECWSSRQLRAAVRQRQRSNGRSRSGSRRAHDVVVIATESPIEAAIKAEAELERCPTVEAECELERCPTCGQPLPAGCTGVLRAANV